jgi:hypothetical protein
MVPAWVAGACLAASALRAQTPPSGNQLFNPLSVRFQRLWDVALPDAVKLIEVGYVSPDKKPRLLQIVETKDRGEYRRKLRVAYWGESRFVPEFETDFQGTAQDVLLAGRFKVRAAPASNEKKKNTKFSPQQIVTTEGIYEWDGKTFGRIMPAPIGVKLALTLDPKPDRLVTGNGDSALQFEVTETEVRQVAQFDLPPESAGYVRFGIGMQDFLGSESLMISAGARYVQSYWVNRKRWLIGVLRGEPMLTPGEATPTTRDRILVFTPRLASRDKSFWSCAPGDLEESWRSEVLPGRVLDVRVGDPRNDGREGLLVLTSENGDKDRRLYFFQAQTSGRD